MTFPNIITNKPVGTQMVSTIDDFERETRTWLEQCMKTISGYPKVNTVGVCGWTTDTKPSTSPNDNYLLGYNTETCSLELVGKSGGTVNISKALALEIHPVGEYYYTSNTGFDPNKEWGGTWEKVEDGRVLISSNSKYRVGSIGGSEKETLTEKQIPSHNHEHSHPHKHTRGTMNITGTFGGAIDNADSWSGAFYKIKTIPHMNAAAGTHWETGFDASLSWTGETSEDDTQATKSFVGGGQAHNNMQPYRVAICWHRVA